MYWPETKIEFVELTDPQFVGDPAIAPNVVRINGQRVLVEKGGVEIIHPLSADDCLKVRLTLLPSEVVFKSEAE